MAAFDELERFVAEGSIKLINIVGVPRSMSTALGRALNESNAPSIFVNEPFNRVNDNLQIASEYIIDEVKATAALCEERQLVVITKNMASYLSHEAFKALDIIADGTVWSIRDPLKQIGSLLTRIVNDQQIGPGSDRISREEIYPFVDDACAFLVDSPKSKSYSKTGWASIRAHFLARAGEVQCVIDGESFINEPDVVLGGLCSRLGLSYIPRMKEGWISSFTNVINRAHPEETIRSAWTKEVTQSKGIVAISRIGLDFECLPKGLQEHILNIAVPTYGLMLAHSR